MLEGTIVKSINEIIHDEGRSMKENDLIMRIIDALFEDEENIFLEPYRDGVNYGVRKSFEEEISEQLGVPQEEVHQYTQEIMEKLVRVLEYVVEGKEEKIAELEDVERYIYEKLPENLKDYVISRYVLKKTMGGPVYHEIEIVPVNKKLSNKKIEAKTFTIRIKLDREGVLFSKGETPQPAFETIAFEATKHDLKEILESIKEVLENGGD